MRNLWLGLALVAVAVGMSACSDDGGSDEAAVEETTTTTEAEVFDPDAASSGDDDGGDDTTDDTAESGGSTSGGASGVEDEDAFCSAAESYAELLDAAPFADAASTEESLDLFGDYLEEMGSASSGDALEAVEATEDPFFTLYEVGDDSDFDQATVVGDDSYSEWESANNALAPILEDACGVSL